MNDIDLIKKDLAQQITGAIDYLKIDTNEIEEHWDLEDALDGSIHEIIDSNVDIYYHSLRQWAVDNWEYIEIADEEGLLPVDFDYHKAIQCGQYVFYREIMDEVLCDISARIIEKNEQNK